ncbi:putative sulfurtransferase [Helianthus anomalus]
MSLMSLSGHKIYSLKGMGALNMSHWPRTRFKPHMKGGGGGGRKKRRKSGIVPTLLVVGMGVTCKIAMKNMECDHIKGKLFDGVENLKEVVVSSGSARLEPSYVLRALGVDEDMVHTSIMFGIWRFTTEDEIDKVVELTVNLVEE